MTRVAVTGLGAVTPVGNDAESTWRALVDGRSGIGPITTFDASTLPVRIVGEVKDFAIESHLPDSSFGRRLNRAGAFGFAAADEAMSQAGAAGVYEPYERAIVMGASAGRPSPDDLGRVLRAYHNSGRLEVLPQPPTALLLRQQNVGVGEIARRWDLQGPMVGLSTACAASTHAIGEAFRLIEEGDAKLVLAGGFDALTTWIDVLGFTLLGALTDDYNDDPERASRPFDATRSGFVLAEGAAAVLLEDLEAARARGARVLAELVGYGSSLNAYRITDAPADGSGPDLSMSWALKDAGLTPQDIDYVVAHGTGTLGNDLCETAAIREVFGPDAYRIAVSSPKSMTGHLTAASGALNVLVAVRAIGENVVPPTTNLEHPDPKLDLDYVPKKARAMEVRAVVANAFAFGGTNASLVLQRADGDGS